MTHRPKYFNTSGPNILEKHYTLSREHLVKRGMDLVNDERYFTIWAPRQGGKSTYFRLLTTQLRAEGYGVIHVNFENYRNAPLEQPMRDLQRQASKHWGVTLPLQDISAWKQVVEDEQEAKWVLIIDEIEGLNQRYFNDFLHTIRSLYHSREDHALKSVILVGVANLAGIIQDNASPFNITDSLTVPYFTEAEVHDLLGQHEQATAAAGQSQTFDQAVKEQISYITAGQPGLVNGLANRLVTQHPDAPTITLEHYYKAEDWYVRKALDKNIANILNKARVYQSFVEDMLFAGAKYSYQIDKPEIKFLHTQGVVTEDDKGLVTFWVPLYKKRLQIAFSPLESHERQEFFTNGFHQYLGVTPEGHLAWDPIMAAYADYVERRGFRHFMQYDPKTGEPKSIKEAAMVYSFESYIQYLLLMVEGTSYLEPHVGLGRSDLIINVEGKQSVVEAKVYRWPKQYSQGLKQLAYYTQRLGADEAIYLVYISRRLTLPEDLQPGPQDIEGTPVQVYHVYYDQETDFSLESFATPA